MHPLITCGFCRACRAGDDMHSPTGFPRHLGGRGEANFLKTSARAVVKLNPACIPKILLRWRMPA